MFRLRRRDGGAVVTMKDGRPFTYSSRQLAVIGRRVLAKHLETALYIEER